MRYTLGIDNGLSGGWVVLSPESQILAKGLFPSRPRYGGRKGKRIDARALLTTWKQDLPSPLQMVRCHLEMPSGLLRGNGGGEGGAAAFPLSTATSMADSYATIRTVLELLGVPVTPVTARKWRNALGLVKGDSLDAALKIFEGQDLRGTPRSRVPHPGILEAALIAHSAIVTSNSKVTAK